MNAKRQRRKDAKGKLFNLRLCVFAFIDFFGEHCADSDTDFMGRVANADEEIPPRPYFQHLPCNGEVDVGDTAAPGIRGCHLSIYPNAVP